MNETQTKEAQLQAMLREISERAEARKKAIMDRVMARWLRERA